MKQKCEIWLVIAAAGDYAVGADRDEAIENLESRVGSAAGARVVKIAAFVARPIVIERVETETETEAA